jgi:hypothetical protein
MAEPQGISRTFQDIARDLVGAYQGFQGFRGEVGRNLGNVGRYFMSQAPVEASPTASGTGMTSAQRNAMIQDKRTSYGGSPTAATPAPTPTPGGPGGAPANPINALFAPMFEDLRRQREQANKRYEANSQQVTNIYGQITGARSADKIATETAFKRLIDAASTRSTAVNTGIDTAEAARLQQNQAALQGMGLEGLSTSQGDIASQTAAQAQQTNTLNAANWEGMLRSMGATAGQQVDADVAAFNFARMEDLGQLRGAREEFEQELGQQRGELRSQRAQATFDYQQAQQRSAAAAKAAEQRIALKLATQQEKSAAAALKRSGPVISGVANALKDGFLDNTQSGAKLTTLFTEFLTMGTPPANETRFNPTTARKAFFDATQGQLNSKEQLVAERILNQIKW